MKLKREKVLALMHLWMWWSNCIHVNAADDSVKPGDRLNLSETSRLYSENRKYYLTLSDGYLTVNHEYIGQKIVVWIDYTNQPVEGNSAVLSLNHSGVLKIESQLGDSIIICSPRQPINNTVATILDTGNFVLQQLHPNGTNTTLWQSFDYSFRNLLPSMKLGVNHKTGHRWIVVSYFANILAYPGTFSLEWEPMGKELVIRRRGIVCWRSGKLRNNRFENIPEDAQRMLKYTIVSNVDEDSFSFTATNNEDVIWAISNDGELVDYDRTLASADMCYGYNDTNGCQRWQDIPMCRHRGDVFQRITGHFYNGLWSELNDTYDSPGCRDICWSNCICAGYKEYYPDGSGCTFFNSELGGYTLDNGGEKFYMLRNLTHRSGNSTTKSSQTPGIQRWKWISAVIASAVFFVCFTILCLVLKKRNYTLQEKKRKEKAMMMSPSTSRNESSALKDFEDALEKGHLKVFNYASIMIATNGFSAENKIGQGGFGDVYKSFDPNEVQRCIHVALLCVEHYANDRPTMSDIISMLTNKSARIYLPKRPAFYVQRDIYDEKFSSKEECTASTEDITSFNGIESK
ncbi:hypothetical protein VNO78_06673 [Psophocarpus tetragonolobus]|uniref:Bulb-type lectin domain-containing protein n=1 Tax=Psophocarpus tetragonolobus TaxID=3891 RepID=A0AAN9SVG7_PSOTE